MTFREFMAQLPNEITPEAAKAEYDRYLADFWGNEARAEFEQRKNDPAVRRRFDPRAIADAVEARNTAAREAAAAFAEHSDPEALSGPPGPFANSEGAAPAQEPPVAPVVCWEDAVAAEDLKVARQLVRTLDAERGVTANPLVPPVPQAVAEDTAAPAGGEGDGVGDGATGDVRMEPSTEDQRKAMETEEAAADERRSPEERLAALDALILYLWVVHGVDFYGFREFAGPDDPSRLTAKCTIRGPRPIASAPLSSAAAPATEAAPDANGTAEEEAGGQEEKEDKDEGAPAGTGVPAASPAAAVTSTDAFRAKRAHDDVLRRWRVRIERGDPADALLQRERIEKDIADFIDRQIIKHDDQKWGNKLSSKLFVAREFVVKHIRNKHGHVVDTERERLLDELYFENYRAARESEDHRRHGGPGGGGGFHPGYGGRGGGRGRGRGRGGFAQPMMGGMMDASVMMAGPIIVPGAGAMGPVMMAPMDMVMPMGMRGRGGRGGRGRGGRGGFAGPVVMPTGGPQYFDLDAPKNNRAVLDYGDL